jgi:hypothetical protein
MSSSAVRTIVKDYLNANWTDTPVIDLSDFTNRSDLPVDLGSWLGIEWVPASEEFMEIGETFYRERGNIIFYIMVESGFSSDSALVLAEKLRSMIKALRIGNMVFETIDPPSDTRGTLSGFSGGYHGFDVLASYYFDELN